jgi:prevent-host-death family protein
MFEVITMDWLLHDAEAKLLELIERAQIDGPQQIKVRGETVAVVFAKKHFDRLTEPKPGLVARTG